eukprot:gene2596-biopygen18569
MPPTSVRFERAQAWDTAGSPASPPPPSASNGRVLEALIYLQQSSAAQHRASAKGSPAEHRNGRGRVPDASSAVSPTAVSPTAVSPTAVSPTAVSPTA